MKTNGRILVDAKKEFQQKLLDWFKQARRELPWRRTYNPYHVWVSEIMLQQTQMGRGVQYFNKWMERFPTVDSVAEADEHEVLKYWEGLGYYSRARNLHKAAGLIKDHHGSQVPCDVTSLLELPGVGTYTAAAVSSIACNRDVSLVDANVARIYSRIYDINIPVKSGKGRKRIEEISRDLILPGKMRLFNQALMDLGGMICTPRNPQCTRCPVSECCLANHRGNVALRPVVVKNQKSVFIRMATGILIHRGRIFIQQRKEGDIWAGLWEFPGGQMEHDEKPEDTVVREYLEETDLAVRVTGEITTVTHSYMHYKVTLYCYYCELRTEKKPVLTAADQYRWVEVSELREFAFPAGHRKLLEYIEQKEQERLMDICSMSML